MLRYMITFGATSWSQAIENLLTEKDKGQPLYADSAYTGEEQEKVYKKKKQAQTSPFMSMLTAAP